MVGADLTETIGLPPMSETLDDTRAEGAHLARARLPALRLDADHENQRVRLDGLQGALALRDLPGAVRRVQMHLKVTP